MKVAVFSALSFDRKFLSEANSHDAHELVFFEARLNSQTVPLANEFPVVCAFVTDQLKGEVIRRLAEQGTRMIALRSAGFNHVDLDVAREMGIKVYRVPSYSPNAIAEHTVALMLALNRKITRASMRVREGNFSLEGLLGFDFANRVIGVVGTGKIGSIVCQIMKGFGCHILANDVHRNLECERIGVQYVSREELFEKSDVITLHCPLTPESFHLIDHQAIERMKPGVMLINTSRGGLIDTLAVIEGLKSKRIGHLGLDVYEEEEAIFFKDLSDQIIDDDVFARLLTFPNVLVTGHQAFFTEEALENIASTTLQNISDFEAGKVTSNTL